MRKNRKKISDRAPERSRVYICPVEKESESIPQYTADISFHHFMIPGVDTNVDYQYGILEEPDYRDGNVDINYIENHF